MSVDSRTRLILFTFLGGLLALLLAYLPDALMAVWEIL